MAKESAAAPQQQFDWSKDSAECVEGLKFDLDTTYEFTLDNFTKHEMVKKDGTKVLYKKGDKEGQPVLMYTAHFKELQTTAMFKLDFFVQDRYRVNENAPETEDDFVKFSRKLGYAPILGTKEEPGRFAPADFIHLGIKISANLKYQVPTSTNEKLDEATGQITDLSGNVLRKAYTQIDVDTIVLDGDNATDSQESLPEEISDDVKKELQDLISAAPKCKKFADLMAKINKAGAKDKSKFELIGPAMQLNQNGQLKF